MKGRKPPGRHTGRRIRLARKEADEGRVDRRERRIEVQAEKHLSDIRALIERVEKMERGDLLKAREHYIALLKSKGATRDAIRFFTRMSLEEYRAHWIAHFERRMTYQRGGSSEEAGFDP